MAVNLLAPDPRACMPVAGVQNWRGRGGHPQSQRKDLSVVLLDEGAIGGRCVHPKPLLRRACANLPGTLCALKRARRHRYSRHGDQHRQRQRGHGDDGLARARATCVALASS